MLLLCYVTVTEANKHPPKQEAANAVPGPEHLEGAEAEDNDDDDEASSKAMEGEASSVAMEGEASSKAMEGEASSEAMEGEASSEAMQEEASWALRRQTLTREEKLQIDSEAAGYRLAHTISESWSDEHMPKTPPQLQEAVSAEPGLLTQKTLLDETPNDRSPDVCTVDSSPDEASSSTRPVLSRRPHVPSKTWNADLSPALTNEQKARFLEACRAKIRTMGAESAPVTGLTTMWGVVKLCQVLSRCKCCCNLASCLIYVIYRKSIYLTIVLNTSKAPHPLQDSAWTSCCFAGSCSTCRPRWWLCFLCSPLACPDAVLWRS